MSRQSMFVFIISTGLIIGLSRCSHPEWATVKALQQQVQRLQDTLAFIREHYKPGLGELMTTIQYNHGKLWFAGIKHNWPLAAFEVGEIRETARTAQEIETDRPEVKDIPMLYPALDSVQAAVDAQDEARFKKAFTFLTTTCNNCHKANHFAFNVITIPTAPPATNQQYGPASSGQ
ncbi:cytochrome c [Thermoflavifilum thermophilum]|uniref:Cytochrome c domain-containing protein n=1 Tax=Thermoflavifilum thermophilum TaxID=1393122 RepID=A0A1I7N784_9BACT|nr:cytochrome c [Thermoflavifilum thermophilum]SFV30530.1 hypothetical protein SAMN05660895_0818 [Thermoflavifilum thermophilum]